MKSTEDAVGRFKGKSEGKGKTQVEISNGSNKKTESKRSEKFADY